MNITTQQNLQAHEAALPVSRFSQCFRDAIEITRDLGFDYLWIDSLCIIQDSLYDLRKELDRMKDIFKGCSLMLAADRVEDDEIGLYPTRPEFNHTSLPLPSNDTEAPKCRWNLGNRSLGNFNFDVLRGSLSSRGWALQERVLAPRILHFGRAQVYWECKTSIWSEKICFTQPFYEAPYLDELRDFIKTINSGQAVTSNRKTAKIDKYTSKYTIWYDLVSEYSCRQLTYVTDRLQAISGVAGLFSDVVQDRSIWGLWQHDIPAGLLWSIQAKIPPVQLMSAPSWSWASIDGEITFHIPSTKWGSYGQGPLEVICEDVRIQDYVGSSSTCVDGQIICCCPIVPVRIINDQSVQQHEDYPFDHLVKQPNSAVCHLDSHEPIGHSTLDDESLIESVISSSMTLYAAMLYCRRPFKKSARDHDSLPQSSIHYCILLESVNGKGFLRRRGYAELTSDAPFNVQPTKIAII